MRRLRPGAAVVSAGAFRATIGQDGAGIPRYAAAATETKTPSGRIDGRLVEAAAARRAARRAKASVTFFRVGAGKATLALEPSVHAPLFLASVPIASLVAGVAVIHGESDLPPPDLVTTLRVLLI